MNPLAPQILIVISGYQTLSDSDIESSGGYVVSNNADFDCVFALMLFFWMVISSLL